MDLYCAAIHNDFNQEVNMPIYEFMCLDCNSTFEKLFFNSNEKVEMSCPVCKSQSLERKVSGSNHIMASGGGVKKPSITERSCGASNKCMTLDIPGPSR